MTNDELDHRPASALADATVLLTGATDGIGRASAVLLAPRVGTLLIHGPQDPAVVEPLISELRGLAGPPGASATSRPTTASSARCARWRRP